ncbi:MAG: TolC family protein [Williamsia sp.]|nr:TolC family protein [Williamsia sp.]
MKQKLVLLLVLCLASCIVIAQSSVDTMRLGSLSETIEKAIRNNTSQAVYKAQQQQAGFDYKAAKGALYPHASGEFLGTDNLHLAVTPVPGELAGRPGTTYYVQFGKKYIYNPGLTLSQAVFDWQSVLQVQIAKGNAELNKLQQASFEQTLKAQVAQLYFAALIAQASLRITNHDQVLADSVATLMQQRLAEGTTDAVSVNSALINRNNITQNGTQSRQLYDQSIANLKNLLGERQGRALLLLETIDTDNFAETAFPALGADKSLSIYQQQLTIAGLQSKLQKAVRYPRLSANLYVGEQQFRNDFGLSFGKRAWSGYRYIGVDLTVPVFTGFTNSNRYKSTLAQQRVARLQYEGARLQSETDDSVLLKNWGHYTALAKTSLSNFRLYGKNLELNKQRFEEGVISLDVYLRAFQDYLAAENNYLNNLSQLLQTKATILSRQ